MKSVPPWEPKPNEAPASELTLPELMKFEDLDITRVLTHGAPLLASGGEEFEHQIPTTKQELAQQKE